MNVGCEELISIVKQIKPSYHIFGHIHESSGMEIIDGTTFINASICNLKYQPINKYYTFELIDKS